MLFFFQLRTPTFFLENTDRRGCEICVCEYATFFFRGIIVSFSLENVGACGSVWPGGWVFLSFFLCHRVATEGGGDWLHSIMREGRDKQERYCNTKISISSRLPLSMLLSLHPITLWTWAQSILRLIMLK